MATTRRSPLDSRPAPHGPLRRRQLAAAKWLLSAADDAAAAQREWDTHGVALLRCGRAFTAVRITGSLVHAAAGTSAPDDVAAFLTDALDGPVYADPRSSLYYALISAAAPWHLRDPAVERFGRDTYLGVPATDRTGPGPGSYWVVPVKRPRRLCPTLRVERLVAAGRARAEAAAGGERGA